MGRFFGYVRVFYPLETVPGGRIALRSELDWTRDIEPVATSELAGGGLRSDFLLEHDRPYLFCKPILRRGEELHWTVGANKLAILAETPQDFYPHFFAGDRGTVSSLCSIASEALSRQLRFRVYLPAGYGENTLKRFPALYMHDGRNLFFPQESFLGQEWEIDETLERLNAMSLIERTIVVGVHAEDRERDYTSPGYGAYGRALTDELKPHIDAELRTLSGPSYTGVMGSSLGGVAAFAMAWARPEVFGNVACLSSTFEWRDDLIERVRCEELGARAGLKVYLDSGWPRDNYEVTLSMANALIERGFMIGRDLVYLAFPQDSHDERAWAERFPLALQLFSGKLRHAARRHAEPSATAFGGARCELRPPPA